MSQAARGVASGTTSADQRGAHLRRGQHVVQRLSQAREQLLQLALAKGQRRSETEDAVAKAAEHDAVSVGGREDAIRKSERRIEAAPGGLVADQFQRAEQTAMARIADQRVLP